MALCEPLAVGDAVGRDAALIVALCEPLAVDTPLLTFRGGAIFEVGLQKFYFEFRDAEERL